MNKLTHHHASQLSEHTPLAKIATETLNGGVFVSGIVAWLYDSASGFDCAEFWFHKIPASADPKFFDLSGKFLDHAGFYMADHWELSRLKFAFDHKDLLEATVHFMGPQKEAPDHFIQLRLQTWSAVDHDALDLPR